MPMAVAVVGFAGAFATTSMASAPVANQQGYRFISGQPNPCHAELMCRTESGDVCKSGAITLWGKATENGPCNVPLFKIP